ncbi:hypothetical protein ACPCUV_24550 [Streptomyces platensis]|uniref:hypothetical protein n=1 Tax=Streptomyces platensis TaxID=58346 RepID=UPI003C2E33EE
MDLYHGHSTPLSVCNDTPARTVSALTHAFLTLRQRDNGTTPHDRTGVPTGMMSTMHATPTETDSLDVETFANPVQQRRFATAMERIAADRAAGDPVRVFISAAPRTMNSPKWDSWLAQITEALPEGVEILHYRNVFSDNSPYDWGSIVEDLDGLVIVGKQKRPGSRVYLLGPIARLELRSLIARKPVLLYGHNLGLIPVIDCKSQVLAPEEAPRLKLIAPKRWRADSETLSAAFKALDPNAGLEEEEPQSHSLPHLAHPFTAPPR